VTVVLQVLFPVPVPEVARKWFNWMTRASWRRGKANYRRNLTDR